MKTLVKYWESLPAFAEACKDFGRSETYGVTWSPNSFDDYWYGGHSKDQARECCLHGYDEIVPKATKIMDSLETSLDIQGLHWVESVSGAFPSVPDYLSGSPTPMRQRVKRQYDTAPIKVYAAVAMSAALSTEDINNRGAAILALIMALERIRPVDLYAICELDGDNDKGNSIQVIPIETQPLDVAIAGYVFTHPSFPRMLCYGWAGANHGHRGGWPRKYDDTQEAYKPLDNASPYCLWLRETLGMSPQDLYIKIGHIGQPIFRDPVKWINDVLTAVRED